MGKFIIKTFKRTLAVILALILLININAEAFATLNLPQNEEISKEIRNVLEESFLSSESSSYKNCVNNNSVLACQNYLGDIKAQFIQSGKNSQEEKSTLEGKKSYKEYEKEYKAALAEEYNKAEEEIEKETREAVLFNEFSWDTLNEIKYQEKKAKEALKKWKESEEKKIKSSYGQYEREYTAWKAKEGKQQEEAGKKYLREEAKKIIQAYYATESKAVKRAARELLLILLNSEEKPGEIIEERESLERIFLEALANKPCDYIKGSKTLTKGGADKYIGYDKPGVYPTLTQEDWQIIEARYKDEEGCKSAFISLEGLSHLKATENSINKVERFIEENEEGLAAGDSLVNGSAVLLRWKAYQNLKRYIKKRFAKEETNEGKGIGGFGEISENIAYNGNYLGKVSVWSQRADGGNAWEDLAELIAEEGSAQSKEILKSAVSSCKIENHPLGKDKLVCQTIMPFLYGAILHAPKVIDEAKPYQESIPKNREYLDEQGRTRQVDVEAIKRKNNYIEQNFKNKLQEYGSNLSSGLAGFIYKIKFNDVPVDSKMALDNKLAKVYSNIKGYSKGSARYNKLKAGRAVVSIFKYVGIAVDVIFTFTLVGDLAKGALGARALIKAKNILKGKRALSVAQRANILRQVAYIKEGGKLRRFGRKIGAGVVNSANIGRKINTSAYLAEKNGMNPINYMLHNIAYRRGRNIALRSNIVMVEGNKNYFASKYYIPSIHSDIFRVSKDVARASELGLRELGEGGSVVSYIDKAKVKIFKEYTQDYIKGQEGLIGEEARFLPSTEFRQTDYSNILPLDKERNLLARKYLYDKEYSKILPFLQDKNFSQVFNIGEKIYEDLRKSGFFVIDLEKGKIFDNFTFSFDGYLKKNNLLGGFIIPVNKAASKGVKTGAKVAEAQGYVKTGFEIEQTLMIPQANNIISAVSPIIPKITKNLFSTIINGKDVSTVIAKNFLEGEGLIYALNKLKYAIYFEHKLPVYKSNTKTPLIVFKGSNVDFIAPPHINKQDIFVYNLKTFKDYKKTLAREIKQLSEKFKEYTIYIEAHGTQDGTLLLKKKTPASLGDFLDIIEENKGDSIVNVISGSCHSGSARGNTNLLRKNINILLISAVNDLCSIEDTKFLRVNDLRSTYIEAIKKGYYGATLFYEGKVFNALINKRVELSNNTSLKQEIDLLTDIYFSPKYIGLNVFSLLKKFSKYQLRNFPHPSIFMMESANPFQIFKDGIFKKGQEWNYFVDLYDDNHNLIGVKTAVFNEPKAETYNLLVNSAITNIENSFPGYKYQKLTFTDDSYISNTDSFLGEREKLYPGKPSLEPIDLNKIRLKSVHFANYQATAINANIKRLQDLDISKFSPRKMRVYREVEEQLAALNKKLENGKYIKFLEDKLENLKKYTELLLKDTPILILRGDDYSKTLSGHIDSKNFYLSDLTQFKDYKTQIAKEIRDFAKVYDDFTVYIAMHGTSNGTVIVGPSKRSTILEIAKIIKDNKGTSDVDLISGACHSGAGFSKELAGLGINTLLLSGRNDVCFQNDLKFLKYKDLPGTYLNALEEGRYGLTLIYDGKVYNPLEQALKKAKGDSELSEELKVLNDIYFRKDPSGKGLGEDIYALLSVFENYSSKEFVKAVADSWPKVPFILNPVVDAGRWVSSHLRRNSKLVWDYVLRIMKDNEVETTMNMSFEEPSQKTFNFILDAAKEDLLPIMKEGKTEGILPTLSEQEIILDNLRLFKENPDILKQYQVRHIPQSSDDFENLNVSLSESEDVVYRGVSATPELIEKFLTEGFDISYVNSNGSDIDVPYDNLIYFASKDGSVKISTPQGRKPRYKLGGIQEAAYYAVSSLYNSEIAKSWAEIGYKYSRSPEQKYALLLEFKADSQYIEAPSQATRFHAVARKDVPSSLITRAWLIIDERTAIPLHQNLQVNAESLIAPQEPYKVKFKKITKELKTLGIKDNKEAKALADICFEGEDKIFNENIFESVKTLILQNHNKKDIDNFIYRLSLNGKFSDELYKKALKISNDYKKDLIYTARLIKSCVDKNGFNPKAYEKLQILLGKNLDFSYPSFMQVCMIDDVFREDLFDKGLELTETINHVNVIDVLEAFKDKTLGFNEREFNDFMYIFNRLKNSFPSDNHALYYFLSFLSNMEGLVRFPLKLIGIDDLIKTYQINQKRYFNVFTELEEVFNKEHIELLKTKISAMPLEEKLQIFSQLAGLLQKQNELTEAQKLEIIENITNKEFLKDKINHIVFKKFNLDYDETMSKVFDFSNNKYLVQLLIDSEKFDSNFENLYKDIKSNWTGNIHTTFDALPENIEFAQQCKEKGIDYQAWRKYDPNSFITRQVLINNAKAPYTKVELTVRKIDMDNISKAITSGNESRACRAVGLGMCREAPPDLIRNKLVQQVEIVNHHRPVGNVLVYLGEVDDKPAIIMGSIISKPPYESYDVDKLVIDYVKEMRRQIGRQDLPIYMSSYLEIDNKYNYPLDQHKAMLFASGFREVFNSYIHSYQVPGKSSTTSVNLYKVDEGAKKGNSIIPFAKEQNNNIVNFKEHLMKIFKINKKDVSKLPVFKIRAGNFLGTGFYVKYRNLPFILTAKHVVKDSKNVDVFNDSGFIMSSEVINLSPNSDLALLSVEEGKLDFAEPYVLALKEPKIGDKVFAIGYPYRLQWKLRKDKLNILQTDTLIDNDTFYKFKQKHINVGSSGGPLAKNEQSRDFYGVIVSGTNDGAYAFSVPLPQIRTFLGETIRKILFTPDLSSKFLPIYPAFAKNYENVLNNLVNPKPLITPEDVTAEFRAKSKDKLLSYMYEKDAQTIIDNVSPEGKFIPELYIKAKELTAKYSNSIFSTSYIMGHAFKNGVFSQEIYEKIKKMYDKKVSFNKLTALQNCEVNGVFREDLFEKILSLDETYSIYTPQVITKFLDENGIFNEEYFEAFDKAIQNTQDFFMNKDSSIKEYLYLAEHLKKAFYLLGADEASNIIISNPGRYLYTFKDLFDLVKEENVILLKEKLAPLSKEDKLKVITALAGSINKKSQLLSDKEITDLINKISDLKSFKEGINRLVFKQFGWEYTPQMAEIFDFAFNKYLTRIMGGSRSFDIRLTSLFNALKNNIDKPIHQNFDLIAENIEFAKMCKENGIDYQAWRSYDPNDFIERKVLINITPKTRKELIARKVDMDNVIKGVTTGNESKACRAVAVGENCEAGPELVRNKMVQQVELLDNNEPVGNVLVYLAEVDGQSAIVMGTLMKKWPYDSHEIDELFIDYVRSMRSKMGRPDMPIYMSRIFSIDNLKNYPINHYQVKLLGSGDNAIFNSFAHDFEVPSDSKVNTIELYKVDEGIKSENTIIPLAKEQNNNVFNFKELLTKIFKIKQEDFLKLPVFKVRAANLIGTGFYIKYRNFPFILTAKHTLEHSTSNYAEIFNDKGFSAKAEILALSKDSDLAVLTLPKGLLDYLHPYTLALKGPKVGDKVIAVGYPDAKGIEKEELTISNTYHKVNNHVLYAHDNGNMVNGSSGSPLSEALDINKLLGVVVQNYGYNSQALSVPLPQIRTFLGETIRKILFTPDLSSKFLPIYPAFAKNYENVLNKYIYTGANAEKPLNLKTDIVPHDIKFTAESEQKGISAKVLFTEEYKNKKVQFYSWDDIKLVKSFLPSNFEAPNVYFRGMAFDDYEDLKGVFEGLSSSKTVNGGGKIFFSDDVGYAMLYCTDYKKYGHLPVLIRKKQDKMMGIVATFDFVEPKDITDVLVWAQLDGKLGWWRASLDETGEVVLQPTDNMQNVNVESKSAEKPLNLKTDIKEVVEVLPWVAKLVGFDGEIKAYYKRVLERGIEMQQDEISRTKLFNTLVEKFAPKYSLINIEYPKVLSTNLSDLPDEIAKKIEAQKVIEEKYGLFYNLSLIMTPVDDSGWFYDIDTEALATLKDKPITNEEWAQVVGLFKDLNKAGFYHNDLERNLFLKRDNNGKLTITIIDFEYYNDTGDMRNLSEIGLKLESIGAKEKNTLKSINNQSLFNLSNWVLPAVGVGLLAFSLANPASAPFALAAVPLMSHNIKLTAVPEQKAAEKPLNFKADIQNGGETPLIANEDILYELSYEDYKGTPTLPDIERRIGSRLYRTAAKYKLKLNESDVIWIENNISKNSKHRDLFWLIDSTEPKNRNIETLNYIATFFNQFIDMPDIPRNVNKVLIALSGEYWAWYKNWVKDYENRDFLIERWLEKAYTDKGIMPDNPEFAKNYENVLNKYIYTGENAEKPLNLKTDIVKANYVKGKDRVLELRDAQDNIRAYYKHTRKGENERTILFDKIITEGNFQSKYPLINIEYPKILSTDVSDLPDGIIPEDNKCYLKNPYLKSAILTPVDVSGWFSQGTSKRLRALNGKPITHEEWAQVVGLFKDLNEADFYHNDLQINLFFRRDNNDKLTITIIDFEYINDNIDMEDLIEIGLKLESIGAKEKSVLKAINNQSLFNLPSWVLPAVGVGLLAFSLANPITAPFALAAVPLMSHNIKLTAVPEQKAAVKPLNLKTDIVKAESVADTDAVSKLIDSKGNIRAYHKKAEKEEIERTLKFNEKVEKIQNKYSFVIEYPKILSTKLSDLSDKVVEDIKSFFDDDNDYQDMILTAVNTSGWKRYEDSSKALIALRGKLITNEEWEQIVNFIKDLNNDSFYHTDLIPNMFFRRDDNGKLVLTIIDFEKLGGDDMISLERIRVSLESIGAKEKDF